MKLHYIVDLDSNLDPREDGCQFDGRRIRCVNTHNSFDVGWFRSLTGLWDTFESFIRRESGVIIIGSISSVSQKGPNMILRVWKQDNQWLLARLGGTLVVRSYTSFDRAAVHYRPVPIFWRYT